MRRFFAVLTVVIVLLVSNLALAAEGNKSDLDKISMRSRVEKSVKANMALVNIGVRVQSSSLASAQLQVNQNVQAVVEALIDSGVPRADIQTARFTVNNFNKDDKNQALLYVVNNNIMIKIHDVNRVGAILDAAFDAGANQMQGIQFTYDGGEAIRSELLQQAVVNGRKQAGLVAAADGRSLGRLLEAEVYNVSVQEVNDGTMMRAMAMSNKIGNQVFSGDVVLSAEANLVFEIK